MFGMEKNNELVLRARACVRACVCMYNMSVCMCVYLRLQFIIYIVCLCSLFDLILSCKLMSVCAKSLVILLLRVFYIDLRM